MMLFGVLIFSCKKDSDEDNTVKEPTSYVVIDGNKTAVDTCYDVYYSNSYGDFYHYYVFVPNNVVYDDFMKDLLGTGDGFVMQFQSDNNSLISEGDYALDSTNTTPGPGMVVEAMFCIKYDFFMSDGDKVDMKSGNVELKDLGSKNRFEIKGTFLGKDKKEYKLYFKGTVSKVWSNYFSISK